LLWLFSKLTPSPGTQSRQRHAAVLMLSFILHPGCFFFFVAIKLKAISCEVNSRGACQTFRKHEEMARSLYPGVHEEMAPSPPKSQWPDPSLRSPPKSPQPQQLALLPSGQSLPRVHDSTPPSRRTLHFLDKRYRSNPSCREAGTSPTEGADLHSPYFLNP